MVKKVSRSIGYSWFGFETKINIYGYVLFNMFIHDNEKENDAGKHAKNRSCPRLY